VREEDRQITQLIRKKVFILICIKLHVSANSGHHQVYYRFKRESYLGGGIDKEISCINFVVLISGVVTVYSTITISFTVYSNHTRH